MLPPVLLIEDDSKIARVVKVYLEGAGTGLYMQMRGKRGLKRL